MAKAIDTKRHMLTRAERFAKGRALRALVKREQQAELALASDRDPVAVLVESGKLRIPSLLPIRYQRMGQSPFTFLRGAAAIMARDLARQPVVGLPVQACGDCHLMNFGAFNTPEGRVLFDINDFDETLPGVDFVVDVKRLATSVAVAALDAGLSTKKARVAALATARTYRLFMAELAALSPLRVWHCDIDLNVEIDRIANTKLRNRVRATLIKAQKDLDADDNLPHLAKGRGTELKIADRPPLIYHIHDESIGQRAALAAIFAQYCATLSPERQVLATRYAIHDFAMKVVGIGSVGTFCAIALLASGDREPLFLQVKEAQRSVLEHLHPKASVPDNQGRRVVEGQRIMQAASDIFLGWTADVESGRDFYVRQLKNRRLGGIGEVVEANALEFYATLCGRTLARAHARSGDAAMISGYLGRSEIADQAIATFAMGYADQTKRDYSQFVQWLKSQQPKSRGKATFPDRDQSGPAKADRAKRKSAANVG
jgi:uncharacterized protein (DUF2252 family)